MYSPDWIKIKRAIINPIITKDDKCFQCTLIVALNSEKIKGHPERIARTKYLLINMIRKE